MRKIGIIVIFTCAILAAAYAAANSGGPSREELDADLAQVRDRIASVEIEAARFEQGAPLRILYEVQLVVLRTTEDMLNQKRQSWIRRIELVYKVDGEKIEPASENELQELNKDLSQAKTALRMSEAKATAYGGLMQIMSLVQAGTDGITVAGLEQQYLFRKYGVRHIPILIDKTGKIAPPRPPIGKESKDRDAL